MPHPLDLLAALLDLAAPEHCAACGAGRGERPWCGRGARVAGLRRLDAPHLCRPCRDLLAGTGPPPELDLDGLPVVAARATGADLVAVVAAWKYHGVRGLAWPLAELLVPAARTLERRLGGAALLVPVPLHRRRRRRRGFDQAAQLTALLGASLGWPHAALLRRVRSTPQQARLAGDERRRRNLARSCRAGGRIDAAPTLPVVLVDDIVTSGATLAEAARALAAAGRPAAAGLALGVRAGSG